MMNPLLEYPVKVFIPLPIWNDPEEYNTPFEKHRAAENWVLEYLGYPRDYLLTICGVMDYICFRFRNEEDAVYFRLTWQ